jgi:hypothetical protein
METPIGLDFHGKRFPTVSHDCLIIQILLLTRISSDIASQVFGGFLAALLLQGIFWQDIQRLTDTTLAAGKPLVSAEGPAYILCVFPLEDQNLGFLLL